MLKSWRMGPRRKIIEAVDAVVDATVLGTGLSCAVFKSSTVIGYINLTEYTVPNCWATISLARALRADAVCWYAEAYVDDELTGARFIVYVCADHDGTTYARRHIRVADDGSLEKLELEERAAGGWLSVLTHATLTADPSLTAGEAAEMLRHAGHHVEVRT